MWPSFLPQLPMLHKRWTAHPPPQAPLFPLTVILTLGSLYLVLGPCCSPIVDGTWHSTGTLIHGFMMTAQHLPSIQCCIPSPAAMCFTHGASLPPPPNGHIMHQTQLPINTEQSLNHAQVCCEQRLFRQLVIVRYPINWLLKRPPPLPNYRPRTLPQDEYTSSFSENCIWGRSISIICSTAP